MIHCSLFHKEGLVQDCSSSSYQWRYCSLAPSHPIQIQRMSIQFALIPLNILSPYREQCANICADVMTCAHFPPHWPFVRGILWLFKLGILLAKAINAKRSYFLDWKPKRAIWETGFVDLPGIWNIITLMRSCKVTSMSGSSKLHYASSYDTLRINEQCTIHANHRCYLIIKWWAFE